MASPAFRPLRAVRWAPDREVPPEQAAEVTVLAPMVGEDAARARRRKTPPHGWVAVHIGVIARTHGAGRTTWFEGEHATHWAWPELQQAERYMRGLRKQGTTVLVLNLWSPVWEIAGKELVEVGSPRHDDALLASLCWAVLRTDVRNSWAHRDMTGKLTWRSQGPGESSCVQL